MKIDYSKKEFTQEEKDTIHKETEILQKKYPNHVPILIQLHSNVLLIDKHKFMVSGDIKLNEYIDSLNKKLINLDKNDKLVIHCIRFKKEPLKIVVEPNEDTLMEYYNKYKDEETNMLIFALSRKTVFKTIKSYTKYFIKNITGS